MFTVHLSSVTDKCMSFSQLDTIHSQLDTISLVDVPLELVA